MPSPPLCESIATFPRAGMSTAKVALSSAAGAVLITPRQLGPTRRMPVARQTSTSSRCARSPAPPTSANPAVTTTRARVPSAPSSRTTSRTPAIGTATIASSTRLGQVGGAREGGQALHLGRRRG